MGQRRTELQALLELLLGSPNVYFQPPASVQMKYPAIVYNLDDMGIEHANNVPYKLTKRYQVTVMDRNPDSETPTKIANLPMCIFDRFFAADGLNHFVFNLYY